MEKLTALTVSVGGRKIQLFVKGTQVTPNGKTVVSQKDIDFCLRALGCTERGQTYTVG